MGQQIECNGAIYSLRNGKWVNQDGCIEECLQSELNACYAETVDFSDKAINEVLKIGDNFKETGSLGLAIRCYEIAIEKANEKELSYILPRITSCYRKQQKPQKVIDVLATAKKNFGEKMITPTLLTSAGAAYCDMGDLQKAEKCCKIAYKKENGKISEELKLVYRRINKLKGE